MTDTIFHIVDNILFLCMGLSILYLFIFALSALLRKSDGYPEAKKKHRFVLLVPPQTTVCQQLYPEDLYTVLSYDNLVQTVKGLDETQYDIAIILGETTRVSPNLLQNVNNVYDTGAMAIQLHHIIENRLTRKIRRQAIGEEIRNSIFKQGHVRTGLSSTFDKMDIALDFKWLKQNMKSPKSNLESRLLQQDIFIEYLCHVKIYSDSARPRPYSMSKWKALSKLPVILMGGNWDYADKLFRQLIPSWPVLLTVTGIWTLFATYYDWTLSISWWLLLFGLLFTISLAIPDYLIVEKRKKKKS